MSNPRDTELLEMATGAIKIYASSSTDATTPSLGNKIVAIVGITDFTITAITGNYTGFSGVTYPAGHTILLRATSVTLASGTVDFYEGL